MLRCCGNSRRKRGLITEIYKVRLGTTSKLPVPPLNLVSGGIFKNFDMLEQNCWIYLDSTWFGAFPQLAYFPKFLTLALSRVRSDVSDAEFNGEHDRRKNFENYVLLHG
jgi:hypothetical protein